MPEGRVHGGRKPNLGTDIVGIRRGLSFEGAKRLADLKERRIKTRLSQLEEKIAEAKSRLSEAKQKKAPRLTVLELMENLAVAEATHSLERLFFAKKFPEFVRLSMGDLERPILLFVKIGTLKRRTIASEFNAILNDKQNKNDSEVLRAAIQEEQRIIGRYKEYGKKIKSVQIAEAELASSISRAKKVCREALDAFDSARLDHDVTSSNAQNTSAFNYVSAFLDVLYHQRTLLSAFEDEFITPVQRKRWTFSHEYLTRLVTLENKFIDLNRQIQKQMQSLSAIQNRLIPKKSSN